MRPAISNSRRHTDACRREAGSHAWGSGGRAASDRPRSLPPCHHPSGRCAPCWLSSPSCRGPNRARGRCACVASSRPAPGAGPQASWLTRSTWGTLAIIPRIVGVSSCTTDRLMRLRPSAFTVASCRGDSPMMLRVSVSLSLLAGTRGLLHGSVVAVAAPASGVQILESLELAKRVDGGLEDVVRIVRPQRLRQDVLDADGFQHGPYRAAGNDAGARHRRLQEHAAGAEVSRDLARNRRLLERHEDQVLLGVLDRLPDGLGDFMSLAEPDADVATAVAHDDQRREGEAPAALDDLGHAVDGDHAV